MRTANTGNGNNNTDKIQKKYKEEEERLLKVRKKREEKEKIAKKQTAKKAEEEKAVERRAERKEQMEKLTEGTYKVSATGMDVKSVIQNIVEAVSFKNGYQWSRTKLLSEQCGNKEKHKECERYGKNWYWKSREYAGIIGSGRNGTV